MSGPSALRQGLFHGMDNLRVVYRSSVLYTK